MTWTKTGVEFPTDCAKVDLGDAAYRTHHEAITWCYETETTTLLVPKRLLRMIAGSQFWEAAIRELVGHGFWVDRGEHYEIVHHAEVVIASIYAQRKRRNTSKETSRRHRRKQGESDTSRDTSRRQSDRQTEDAPEDEQEGSSNPRFWKTAGEMGQS